MKNSQKESKINTFQKSPFGRALLIATRSTVKSVRQFGHQPIEKATTTPKKRCLSKSKCGSSKTGLRLFPFSHFLNTNINHPSFLASYTVPLIFHSGNVNKKSPIATNREKFLRFCSFSATPASPLKGPPHPLTKTYKSLLSLGCC